MSNDWVITCSTIYKSIGEMLIFPFMELLGLDRFKSQREERANWFEIKAFFFDTKIPELKAQRKKLLTSEVFIDQLHATVIEEVTIGLERQLSKMIFFNTPEEEQDPEVLEKMKVAEVDNLKCESSFGRFDHVTKMGVGNESVQTLSYKATVRQNGAFSDEQFLKSSAAEKMDLWKHCKTSDEAKAAHDLGRSLVQDVKAAKVIAQEARKKLKRSKAQKLLDVMTKAIKYKYGGPLSIDNIDDLLFKLDLKQTLNEIKLARAALDVSIRQKYLVKDAGGKGHFVNEPLSQLKKALQEATKPTGSKKQSVEELLRRAYSNIYAHRRVKKQFDDEIDRTIQHTHYGTVTDMYDPGVSPLYQIVYDDLDEETLYLHELEKMLLPENAAESS
jgi:hypothetical protein